MNNSSVHTDLGIPVLERLRKAREEDGRSYAQLARATGLPIDRLLAEIRDGSTVLLVTTAVLLAHALNLSIRELFREEQQA